MIYFCLQLHNILPLHPTHAAPLIDLVAWSTSIAGTRAYMGLKSVAMKYVYLGGKDAGK
jgi:hypothetical protein